MMMMMMMMMSVPGCMWSVYNLLSSTARRNVSGFTTFKWNRRREGTVRLWGRLLMCDMMSCRWRHWEHRLNVNMRQRSTFNHQLQRRRLPQPRAGKNPRHHLYLQQQQQPPQRQWRQCVIVIKHQLNNYNSRCSSHRSTQLSNYWTTDTLASLYLTVTPTSEQLSLPIPAASCSSAAVRRIAVTRGRWVTVPNGVKRYQRGLPVIYNRSLYMLHRWQRHLKICSSTEPFLG